MVSHVKRKFTAAYKGTFANNVREGSRAPDLSEGSCMTPDGRRVMSAYVSAHAGAEARARQLCGDCPVRPACGNWALKDETPPGDWGGMYGGMTPKERVKEVLSRE